MQHRQQGALRPLRPIHQLPRRQHAEVLGGAAGAVLVAGAGRSEGLAEARQSGGELAGGRVLRRLPRQRQPPPGRQPGDRLPLLLDLQPGPHRRLGAHVRHVQGWAVQHRLQLRARLVDRDDRRQRGADARRQVADDQRLRADDADQPRRATRPGRPRTSGSPPPLPMPAAAPTSAGRYRRASRPTSRRGAGRPAPIPPRAASAGCSAPAPPATHAPAATTQSASTEPAASAPT